MSSPAADDASKHMSRGGGAYLEPPADKVLDVRMCKYTLNRSVLMCATARSRASSARRVAV